MKTEENFYDIIGSKFNDQQAPFDEQNWQSMRKMIDDSRSEKRRTMWLLVAACLLLFSGATFGIYEWSNNTGAAQHNNAGNITKNAHSSSALTGANKQTANIVSTNATTTNKTINESSNTPISSNGGTSLQNQSNVNVAANSGENSNKINEKKYIIKSHNKKNTLANSSSEPVTSIAENANSGDNRVTGMNEQNNLSSTKGAASTVSGNVTMPSNSISVKTTGSLAKVNSHKADSMAAANTLPQRFSDEPRIFQGKANIFSVEVGGEYSGGWEIGSVDQGKGFNVNGGVGYAHYLGSRLFLKTGLLFSTFNNMSPLTYNYQHNVGNVIYDSVITTKRLYFLKIPIQLEYFVGRNKRSSVGVGGSVWFLVGNRGFATTYQQVDNNPPMNMQTYSQNIPIDGYNKINFSGHILYRYVLSHKLSMYAMFYMELSNMKNNSFFGENIVERTNGIQYTLSYNLY